MAVSASLRRLLRVRTLEEELSRQALESAMGELRRLEAALATSHQIQRAGRKRFTDSVKSGELADRLAGTEQERCASWFVKALEPYRHEAQQEAEQRREDLLTRRTEMRQAETLVKEAEKREAVEADRRAQLTMDDWFGSRLHRSAAEHSQKSSSADEEKS